MIDHISLPVSDYARSRAFYDKALGALGYKVAMEITDAPDYVGAGYGPADAPEPAFWIGAARAAGAGTGHARTGQHIAFQARRPRRGRRVPRGGAGGRRHATMARPACGRTTIPTTMPPSCSTRTAIGSRRCATAGVTE